MNLSQAIADRFKISQFSINYQEDKYTPIHCPYPDHNDSDSSAGLNFRYKHFNCFVCGGASFQTLAHRLQIPYDESIEETNIIFEDFFDNFIESNTKARPVVLRKQVEAYTNFLLERKLKPETIEEIGGYYISDESHQDYGHLVFNYGVDKYGQPKYVKRRIIGTGDRFRNSTTDGTESKALFGGDFVSRNTVVLVEGVSDYATLWQRKPTAYGIAASFGAKLSKQQAYLLRNKIIFILYDRDYEGYSGAIKAAELLREFGCTVIILEIPDEFADEKFGNKIDVNSAYCKSGDKFFDWLDASINKYSLFDDNYISTSFLAQDQRPFRRLRTNIAGLDSALSGGFPVGLHAIAGKEKVGKSSMFTFLEVQAALQGLNVLDVTYELSKEQKWSRIASHISNNAWTEIEANHLILDYDSQLALASLSKHIRIEKDWTIDEIKAASKNFDVICIDYIQRMPYEGNDERQGIKRNTYELGNLAYSGEGKIVICLSSMPETGTTIFKETNAIKYAVRTGWILSKFSGNLLELECIANTGGLGNQKIYLEMNYANQRPKEVPPPELKEFTQ